MGKHRSHLDDTYLFWFDHHFSKFCGDQELTLLWDFRDKNKTKGGLEKRKLWDYKNRNMGFHCFALSCSENINSLHQSKSLHLSC